MLINAQRVVYTYLMPNLLVSLCISRAFELTLGSEDDRDTDTSRGSTRHRSRFVPKRVLGAGPA
jgi:hypothetical protein